MMVSRESRVSEGPGSWLHVALGIMSVNLADVG